MVNWSSKCLVILVLVAGCGDPDPFPQEKADFVQLSQSFSSVSLSVTPLLKGGAISNLDQLCGEYQEAFPTQPRLFEIGGWTNDFSLPDREYCWLTNWSAADNERIPILWSYFTLSQGKEVVVLYLEKGGAERLCKLSEFVPLIAQLSNRVDCGKSGIRVGSWKRMETK